jgi:dienelactone hydrolase
MFSATTPKDSSQAAAWPTFAPLREYIAAADGETSLRADEIIAATVFTTGPQRDLLARAREAVYQGPLQISDLHTCAAAGPSPCASDPGLTDDERAARSCTVDSAFTELQGRVTLPIFQEGRPPYASLGGKIQVDGDGVPVLHDVQSACFSLVVPSGETPAAGWPTLVFAHGTGGSFRSAIAEGLARRLADAGIATLSVEGLLHGTRRGDSDSDGLVDNLPLDQLVFNLRNPDSARDNPLQAAIDQFTSVRLARNLAEASAPEAAPTTLDPANVFFMGHSQGAQAGVAFLPFEPEVHAAVLSGVGANLLQAILAKTEPQVTLPGGLSYPPAELLQLAFQERPDRPLTSAHPLLLLFNTFVNRSDADAYSPMLRRQALPEIGAKHILAYMGHTDHYTPLRSAGSFVIGAGLEVGEQNLFPAPCDQYTDDRDNACGYTTSGFLPVTPLPASGNQGGVTSVVLMREQSGERDGHFVAFAPAEQDRIVAFFTSAKDGAVPVVND